MTIIAALIGLVLYHELAGVREGTVIAAMLVGMIACFLKRKIGFLEERLFLDKEKMGGAIGTASSSSYAYGSRRA